MTLRVSRIATSAAACEPIASTIDTIIETLYGLRNATSRRNVERYRGAVGSFT